MCLYLCDENFPKKVADVLCDSKMLVCLLTDINSTTLAAISKCLRANVLSFFSEQIFSGKLSGLCAEVSSGSSFGGYLG